jgi:hypothetical protein
MIVDHLLTALKGAVFYLIHLAKQLALLHLTLAQHLIIGHPKGIAGALAGARFLRGFFFLPYIFLPVF